MALKNKGTPRLEHLQPQEEQPWFLWSHRANREATIIFGHWSTLGFDAGDDVYALDTGCLWGGALTALRLEDKQVFQVPCPGACVPTGDI